MPMRALTHTNIDIHRFEAPIREFFHDLNHLQKFNHLLLSSTTFPTKENLLPKASLKS